MNRLASWMAPEAQNKELLYISDYYGVHVFSYPEGSPVGDLTGFAEPEGLCSDRAGHVFVTDDLARLVYEYAHGGTQPIARLYDNYVDFNPSACSVDPTTNNLAVTSQDLPYVVVFLKARQKPVAYSDPYAIMFYCAYDDTGNLFVDKVNHGRKSYIGELRNGSKTFKNFLLDRRAGNSGSIQFDGQHVAVDDLHTNVVHQLRFSGSKAVVVGSTPLRGARDVQQFWIQGGTIIGPDLYGSVYFWKYPAGGSPVNSIQGFTEPIGSTISAGS